MRDALAGLCLVAGTLLCSQAQAGSCTSPREFELHRSYRMEIDTTSETDSLAVVCGDFQTNGPEMVFRTSGPTGCFWIFAEWRGSENAAIYLTIGDCSAECVEGLTGSEIDLVHDTGGECYGPTRDYFLVVDSVDGESVVGTLSFEATFADPVETSSWGEIKRIYEPPSN